MSILSEMCSCIGLLWCFDPHSIGQITTSLQRVLDSNHENYNSLQRYSEATSNLRDSSAGKSGTSRSTDLSFVAVEVIAVIGFKLMGLILQSELEGFLSAIA